MGISVQRHTRSSEVQDESAQNHFGNAIGTGVGVSMLGCGRGLTGRSQVNATEPPVIPVGLDAFRMWDRWAYLRIGQRTYMPSTYDRRGANEGADASHFLYQLADDRNVTLDVMGTGVLAFVRTNHWHGSPWHYIVDGRDHIVQETSTADPDHRVENSVFIPQEQFPHPLTWTWSITKGADLMWVPIPFERSFTMAYGRTHYGTGYYIYHKFLPDAPNLSRPIKSWNMDVPPADVLDLINRSGTDIAAGSARTASAQDTLARRSAGEARDLSLTSTRRPRWSARSSSVVSEDQAKAFGEAFLRVYWDGSEHAFRRRSGQAVLRHRLDVQPRQAGVSGQGFPGEHPLCRRAGAFRDVLPDAVPCATPASSSQAAPEHAVDGLSGASVSRPTWIPANWVGYFHATYVDHGEPKPGRELVFLDTTKAEGGGDWCGHFVGTSFIFSDRAVLSTLEGDPRFFFDDSNSPQAQGTGTEEWGGGGDYWGGRNMTLPFAGHPVGCAQRRRKPRTPRTSSSRRIASC